MKLQSLQTKINERAQKRQREDWKTLEAPLNLLHGVKLNLTPPDKCTIKEVSILSQHLRNEFFEQTLAKYIESETAIFLEEIEDLKRRVSCLEDTGD
jgi:adenosyl cobinamide kinase/adenosyl cobinamide phosphate guanylyltransferase